METPISQTMDLVNGKAEYDAQAKLLLSHKVILAKIIHMLIPEYADIPEADICEKYIQDGVKIGVVATDPDVKDLPQTKVGYRILPLSQESSEVKSGKIYYDIVFTVSHPMKTGELTHIYINLEEQLTYNPGYPISTRAIYYLCRLISQQKGVEFEGEDYGKIKKCYSIWLCPDRKDEREDFITRISLGKEDLFGEARFQKSSYDKMVAFICSFKPQSMHPLLRFLATLLTSSKDLDERKTILENEYSISMNNDMKGVWQHMCNLSDGIYLDGYEHGVKQGIEKGELIGTIKTLKDFNFNPQQIFEKLVKTSNLSKDLIKACIKETLGLPKEFVFQEVDETDSIEEISGN